HALCSPLFPSSTLFRSYISRVLTDVEPNDRLHYDHTSAYHHTEGRLIANFDWGPPLHILGVDEGGMLDTVAFIDAENMQGRHPRSEEHTSELQSRRDLV